MHHMKASQKCHMKASLGLASANLASSWNVTIFVSFGRTDVDVVDDNDVVNVDDVGSGRGRFDSRVFSARTSFSRSGLRSAPFRIS